MIQDAQNVQACNKTNYVADSVVDFIKIVQVILQLIKFMHSLQDMNVHSSHAITSFLAVADPFQLSMTKNMIMMED